MLSEGTAEMSTVSSYKGNEPYIFISYSHKDAEKIQPIVQGLADRGFRVWYDEGIEPGTEWPEFIAQQISASACCIAFISESSLNSQNCRREINYAIQTSVPLLTVYLEPVELSPGMALQLSPVQALFSYRFPPDEFPQVLSEVPLLRPCRDADSSARHVSGTADSDSSSGASSDPAASDSTGRIPFGPSAAGSAGRAPAGSSVSGSAERVPAGSSVSGSSGRVPAGSGAADRPQPPKNRKKFITVTALIAALGVCAAAALWFLLTGRTGKNAADSNRMRVQLTAPETMSVRDFSDSVNILEDRINILSDGQYEMDVREDTVSLSFPKDVLGGADPDDVLRDYIARPEGLYACNADTREFIPLSDGLESAELLEGSVDGADAASLGIEGDTYSYFKLTLSSDWMDRNPSVSIWGDHFAFALDAEAFYPNIRIFSTLPSEDPSTWYLISADQQDNLLKLLEYNLTHSTLTDPFSSRIVANVKWEEPKSSQRPGEYQVRDSDLSSDNAWVTFSASSDSLSEGERIDSETGLKKRLDALQVPYAFGIAQGDETAFSARIETGRLDQTVLNLIAGAAPEAVLSCGGSALPLSSGEIVSAGEPDGSGHVSITLDETSVRTVSGFLLPLSDEDKESVYLFIDSYPVLAGKASDWTLPDITFDRTCYDGYTAIGEDSAWVIRLTDALCTGPALPCMFVPYLEEVSTADTQARTSGLSSLYESLFDQTRSDILKQYPDAEVTFSDSLYTGGLTADVNLHFTDTAHASAAAREILEICDLIDFEHSWFAALRFVAAEGSAEAADAAVTYRKSYKAGVKDANRLVQVITPSIVIPEGTLTGETDEFRSLLESLAPAETEAEALSFEQLGVKKDG